MFLGLNARTMDSVGIYLEPCLNILPFTGDCFVHCPRKHHYQYERGTVEVFVHVLPFRLV